MHALSESSLRPLSYREVVAKYPEVPHFIILKIDVQRRGVTYTEAALTQADPARHMLQARSIFHSIGEKESLVPISLLLRDGTSILSGPRPNAIDPYVVDFIDGRLVLTDHGEVLEEVEYWLKPDFHDRFTSSGKPMWQVATPRPQRIDINPYAYCHYWDDGKGCKYCNIAAHYNKERRLNNKPLRLDPRDAYETVREAIRQPGRFLTVGLTCGSILGEGELFAEEVDIYIETLQAIGENFTTRRFPSQLVASAFSLEQLQRIHEQTGLLTYTSDIEVLDEEKFNWICPGKAVRPGYREWKRRLVDAVGIFGRGYVNTGIVGGVETARPHGFATEEDGLRATLEEAEDLASKGVSTVYCVWVPITGSVFHKQQAPSLEYFVRLAKGLDSIRRYYGLLVDMDNYRICGNHPDTDLSRI
ncbi:radical SAM protein [Rhodocyclus tenuis]|uniref:Radical SAM protein n=2 Tax=Rhodocyclus TaxID=1064 RepID=A0A6L5JZV2_RHOTE|nr:radical SAM protein [Rhodocyclus gracilis]MQY52372.1 radical SAM protein [Rhodocyclus gracilis]MRD73969.1 radical SAM protein [Rhodocyclus gracilis]NJA90206.1 radical SAM protein [Rhodocyclus gracilis]